MRFIILIQLLICQTVLGQPIDTALRSEAELCLVEAADAALAGCDFQAASSARLQEIGVLRSYVMGEIANGSVPLWAMGYVAAADTLILDGHSLGTDGLSTMLKSSGLAAESAAILHGSVGQPQVALSLAVRARSKSRIARALFRESFAEYDAAHELLIWASQVGSTPDFLSPLEPSAIPR